MTQSSAMDRALISLDGLSIGDAFGERFFGPSHEVLPRIGRREVPETVWPYTDDTEMALALTRVLLDFGFVHQDALAQQFAERMQASRGYGRNTFEILWGIRMGKAWRTLSRAGFDGLGSFGNGAAMRVAPLGAFFVDRSLEDVVEQARLSSEVTHAHEEGVAGGIAVAVAARLAWLANGVTAPLGPGLLEAVRDATPTGATRDGIDKSLTLAGSATPLEAARLLGNGAAVTAPDTVPFCLWVCSRFSHDFEEAMWSTVTALGDRDTTCAIVGGIVACQTGREGIPEAWFDYREPIEV